MSLAREHQALLGVVQGICTTPNAPSKGSAHCQGAKYVGEKKEKMEIKSPGSLPTC